MIRAAFLLMFLSEVAAANIHRVPWTKVGGSFLIQSAREMCQGARDFTRCEAVNPSNIDEGFRVYRNTGEYLYTMDRAIAEEVQQDYGLAQTKAEEHHPYSAYIARKEAEKSTWDYYAVACATGFGPYCGGMAAKAGKFKDLVSVGCGVLLGTCQKLINDQKNEIQKEIDRVLKECEKSDQACFDAITGGGETQARAQTALEKSSGARPPHIPTGPTTLGRPVELDAEGKWVVWPHEGEVTITE
jgi:hypothetical protein